MLIIFLRTCERGFNPNLVRLRHENPYVSCDENIFEFQSQLGSIKTRT
ncbi:hypothetical protein THTE_4440 [Thermogutta terrifontis]|uniref:Uncharacterized protein n=1 Tax=Thermogutta terrifontis TaxID=1331910 RepID=A0A286RM72_9BACT|nr:hypothetical protein THTE_4440 [Thermogutta terrifontis]